MKYELDKRFWTDADFEIMGWHDNSIYKVCLTEDLELDIDYILKWNQPEFEGMPFTFWIAPATLIFKNIKNLNFEFTNGFDSVFEIDYIEKPSAGNENRWTIITQQGCFQFHCDGFELYIRQDPFFEFTQTISYIKRYGFSVEKTIMQENPNRYRDDVIKQEEKALLDYQNVKKRFIKKQELIELNNAKENGQIDTKTFLIKKKEIADIIFSYTHFLKGTQFENWGL